jgi:hypothetical protein
MSQTDADLAFIGFIATYEAEFVDKSNNLLLNALAWPAANTKLPATTSCAMGNGFLRIELIG